MSKIDTYKKQRDKYNSMLTNIRYARGLRADGTSDPNNDKAHIQFRDSSSWSGDAHIHLHMSYGYYGSSSACDCNPNNFTDYLLKALNKNVNLILDDALRYAKEDMDEALLDCKEEAENILKKIYEEVEVEE